MPKMGFSPCLFLNIPRHPRRWTGGLADTWPTYAACLPDPVMPCVCPPALQGVPLSQEPCAAPQAQAQGIGIHQGPLGPSRVLVLGRSLAWLCSAQAAPRCWHEGAAPGLAALCRAPGCRRAGQCGCHLRAVSAGAAS